MRFYLATHSVKQNEDGTYNVIRNHAIAKGNKPLVELENLMADEGGITMLPEGAVLVSNKGIMTLYATERIECQYYYKYGNLYKFLDEILEYYSFGDVFLYRTVEGWFFFFYSQTFWMIGNKETMKDRVKGITKLCDADAQILECNVLTFNPMRLINDYYEPKKGYVVKTSKGDFILYEARRGSIYGSCSANFIALNRYGKIRGYELTHKIYPNSGKKFFISSLSSESFYEYEESDLIQKITCWGNGLLLAKNGKKSKLLFCKDGYMPKTVVDWGIHSITLLKLEINNGQIVAELLVDSGETQYTKRYEHEIYGLIPKVKKSKKKES